MRPQLPSMPATPGTPGTTGDRLLLTTLIIAVWAFIAVVSRVLPQISGVILILTFMTLYGWLLSAAQVHRKRKERKQAKALAKQEERQAALSAIGQAPLPTASDALQPVYQPSVSVLVPAHNEALVVERLLVHLMAQDYPDFDIWVIDDRSSDGTAEVLKAFDATYQQALPNLPKHPAYHYYTRQANSTPGKSAVLNEALTHAKGEVIAVFDADATMAPNFLSQLMPSLADAETGAVQARKVIVNGQDNFLAKLQDYEYSLDSLFQCGRDCIHGAVELRGNGQLVKRTALDHVGGWNEASVTDDLDLSTKLHLASWDIRFAHKVVVQEEGITRIKALLRQRRRWSEGNLSRNLQYAWPLLSSTTVSLRNKADMIAYFIQFLFPLWLMSDYVMLGWDLLTGNGASTSRLVSSLFLMPLLSVFFSSALIVAIYRFNKPPLTEVVMGALETGLYMTWAWIPVTLWLIVRRLFQRNATFDWGKTQHFGV
jgi:1,2-diacylglycerol 3-beta-glucosyltransferase